MSDDSSATAGTPPPPERLAGLIPGLREEWGPAIDLRVILSVSGSIELALLYGDLFWPTFVEHDGMVFKAGGDIPKSASDWMSHTSNDRTKVEKVMNHEHLFEIHEAGEAARSVISTPAQLQAFGELLQQMWRAKLAQDFPGREFKVELFGDPHEGGMGDYQISFWQVRAP